MLVKQSRKNKPFRDLNNHEINEIVYKQQRNCVRNCCREISDNWIATDSNTKSIKTA